MVGGSFLRVGASLEVVFAGGTSFGNVLLYKWEVVFAGGK